MNCRHLMFFKKNITYLKVLETFKNLILKERDKHFHRLLLTNNHSAK